LIDTGSPSPSSNLYGYLQQLYLLKKKNRGLKVLLSVGGTTFSPHFASPASTEPGRSKFAASVLALIENIGFDGVDIDWEYPASTEQATDMVLLLKEVRQALLPNNYTVSVACPGPFGYMYLLPDKMDQYVDIWNLMAYDYVGSWSSVTGDQANLFRSGDQPETTPFDTESIIKYYTSQGISSTKIVLGMPLYGRYFNGTGGLGQSFSGSGTYSMKDLPLKGATEYYDCATGSSHSYNAAGGQLVSYDNVEVAKQKAAFIQTTLGGAMYWESSEDGAGDKGIIQAVTSVLQSIDSTLNELSYPNSTYDNIRNGMPDSTSAALSSTTSAVLSSITGTLKPSTTATSIAVTLTTLPSTTVSSAICSVGNTLYSCQQGICMCALDPTGHPSCLVIEGYCLNKLCTNNSACDSGEICWSDDSDQCNNGAHCIQVVAGGCITNPKITAILLSDIPTASIS
jgi:chitinase